MPDRTIDPRKRQDSTNRRKLRWRERQRAKKKEAARLAKIAHRAELDRIRAEKGLPPILSSTERARQSRERKAAAERVVQQSSWYSPAFADYREAKAYLTGAKPEMPEQAIENVLEETRREAAKWQLRWNRFVVTRGIQQARLRRAILWQILDALYQGDMTHLKEAMKRAEDRTDIAFEEGSHPTTQFQERQRVYDTSQTMLREGSSLNLI